MRRRTFLSVSAAVGLAAAARGAGERQVKPVDIPKRTLGRTGEQLTIVGQAGVVVHSAFRRQEARARLNCLAHILNLIPYKKVPREKVKVLKRSMKGAYDDQASLKGRKFVPEKSQLPVAETVRGFKEILEGKHDAVSEGDFYMKGGIDEVKPS